MANEFKVRKGLVVNGSGSVLLDIQGSQGQLFSVTDQLSGSLFSVSDISGIPVMEAFSDNTVKIGKYGSEAIKVSGSAASVTGSFSGSFSGSFFGSGSQSTSASYAYTASSAISSSFATFAYSASFAPGFSVSMSQATPALTWSFTHNLNSRNPVVQVYDTTYAQIIPNQIVGMNNSTAEIRFDYAQAGYAVFSNGGGLYVTGSTSTLVQTVGAATWSFTHNLNNKYNTYEVYDNNDYVLIPSAIKAVDNNSAELYFSGLQTGRAIAQFSGINGAPNATTASYALTASFILPLSQSVSITGSGTTNSTLDITGIQANSAVNPPKGTISLYYDGVDGATAGVYGASVIFSQRYHAVTAAPIAIGMIAGVKVNSDGNFGGGLTFWTSDETFNNLAERARIDVSGRMAIGHKSPTALLHVSGSGSGSLMQISSHVSSSIVFVSGSGNVGIGTSTPAKKLDVLGDIRLRTDATGLGPSLILNNGTEAANNYSQIAFGGTSNSTTYLKGGIAYVTLASTNGRGDMYFLQNSAANGNNAGLSDAVMVITNTGSVGIGLINPSSKLHISGSGSGSLFQISSTVSSSIFFVSGSGNVGINTATPSVPLSFGSDVGNKIALYDAGSTTTIYGFGIQSSLLQIFANTSTNRVGIGYGNSTSFTETLTVKGLNVGINKTSPSASLDVSGSMLVTGSLAMSGSFTQVGYKILTTVSQSLNYSDDTAAAAGGVPLGGLYRNGNFILIRLS